MVYVVAATNRVNQSCFVWTFNMPSNHISRLSSAFWQGVHRSIIGQEAGLPYSLAFLIGKGKNLLGRSTLLTPGLLGSINNLHVLLRPGPLAAAQSNLYLENSRQNLSVLGAESYTSSIPVSGHSFRFCGYHTSCLLSESSRGTSGVDKQKAPMALSNARVLSDNCSLCTIISWCRQPLVAAHHHCISFNYGSNDCYRKARMSLRNEEKPNNFLLYGYFAYNIAKDRGNSNPYSMFGWRNFHTSPNESFFAGPAPDASFDSSVHEDQLANSADSALRKTLTDRALKLQSGSCYLPHPDKEETGGEDAHFICAYEQAVGVADGVGGWADLGVNAGLYARELMSNSVTAVREEPKGSIDPSRVLEKAYLSTKAKGSSTACIIALTDQGLHAINLGDSGFIVVRDGSTVFRSPVQQHDFNFTFQLESGNGGDLPSSGEVFAIPVAPGDVIVAGTDGLFDNLYNDDITAVVVHAMRAGLVPQVTAQKIAALARKRAQDKNRQTPFSAAAQEAGFHYYGGKLDDITVVVSYITIDDNRKSSKCNSG